MNYITIKTGVIFILLQIISDNIYAQSLKSVELLWDNGLSVSSFNRFQTTGYPLPLFTFLLNDVSKSTTNAQISKDLVVIDNKLSVLYSEVSGYNPGLKAEITFVNISKDTLRLGNVVPFGESGNHVYITGKGDNGLSRTHLFRPGYEPVNVIVPDNAWELGFATIDVDNGSSICALMRRNSGNIKNASLRRFETLIYPGGSVSYNLWMDSYIGTWQEGLRLMFQARLLYDIEPGTFNNDIFEKDELKWIRQSYVGHFVSVWHNYFYSYEKSEYTFPDFQRRMKSLYGGDDYDILWHAFPMLGMDQRNQWDLFRDLPGGISKIKELSDNSFKQGSSFFTAYNPWDLPAAKNQLYNSTRYKNPIQGLIEITKEAHLRGVMYDTRSESSTILQQNMEKIRPDFIIFPEGMCTPANMQNCLIGRVHAALTHAPMLNLTKFIKPEFAIFRQTVINKEPIKRDFATSFFNGYGVEIHLNVPQDLLWLTDLYTYLGRSARILRENSLNFTQGTMVPLLPTAVDSVWVNMWDLDQKTIYTIFSIKPQGYGGTLFEVDPVAGMHFVDLWNHLEIKPAQTGGKWCINVSISDFNPSWLGTENEGENGCIAQLPSLLLISGNLADNNIVLESKGGDKIKIWKGNPSYQKQALEIKPGKYLLNSFKVLEGYNGKIVIQLFQKNTLLDQRVLGVEEIRKEPVVVFAKSEGKSSYHSENISVELFRQQDILKIERRNGKHIEIAPRDLPPEASLNMNETAFQIKLMEHFGRYEGDFIIRLFDNNNKILDQCTINMPYGYPRISGQTVKTITSVEVPEDMVMIHSGPFQFEAAHIGNWDLKYPMEDTGKVFTMSEYLIDKYPVTNTRYNEFIEKSGYKPANTHNYLNHWIDGKIPPGEKEYPVVYVSIEDAKAYAGWSGKRLPTEKEWQYAAQAGDGRQWPWGNEKDTTGLRCNSGNGIPDPVGKYPSGVNPWGLYDLTGSVWQITNDVYKSGTIDYFILKGGSYFTTLSSWWYVKGGALPLINRQQQYRVSPGYERAATIGFRCVKDVN